MNSKLTRRDFLKMSAAVAGTGILGSVMPTLAYAENAAEAETKKPKYIFLFIGDGMGTAQIQSTCFYKGTNTNKGAVVSEELGFMKFPAVGSVTTYDSTSFCPDSASTATSIATGHKTLSGTINMDPETKSVPYETVAEKLHSQLGYKIGVLTTVNMNHATPAAFYAHQASRKNYYDIGTELTESGFEYFAGGAFLSPDNDGQAEDILTVAEKAGYTVVTTQADAESVTGDKILVIAEALEDEGAMNYAMDAAANEWQLKDYVKKGIDLLNNDTGFFMMAEGGKIDWACHANDAAACIHDVDALDQAVAEAVTFYNEHPDETLILVTADHETGGLAIGYKTTNYDTYLTNLANQKISYIKFDQDYVTKYCEEQTAFEDVLTDIRDCFGLTTEKDAEKAPASELVMTAYELEQIQTAYQRTLEVGHSKQAVMSQHDYELYGTYQPLSMTICHVLNHKSGVDHTTYAHTGASVNIYAIGAGAEKFSGAFDNTEIYNKLAELTGIE